MIQALKMCDIDCECPEDFYQYYRNRWFAFPNDTNVHPVQCVSMDGPRVAYAEIVEDSGKMQSGSIEFRDLRKMGKFGIPTIGNTVYGDTYQYLWNFARRESVKGLSLERMQTWSPDPYGLNAEHTRRIVNGPMSKNLNLSRALVWNVYNPKYWTFEDAVKSLNSGERIGCPLDARVGLHLAKESSYIFVSSRFRTVGYLVEENKIKMLSGFDFLADIIKLSLPKEVEVVV